MSNDLNQCNFIGRIGKDLELKHTPSGTAVLNISIACGDDYKDKSGDKVEQTNWINLVFFGKLAEIAGQYCHKGSKIFVSGKQVTRKWQDKEGNDKYTTEIVVNNMQMLDSKKESEPGLQSVPNAGQPSQPVVDDFDPDTDLPF